MIRQTRDIVLIDENLCDGCGQCILSCAEGAIQIIDGKAKLVSDSLCDGFGNCLGSCPQDAITIIEREADEFDESAVEEHLESLKREEKPQPPAKTSPACPGSAVQSFAPQAPSAPPGGGCPGSALRMFDAPPATQPRPTSENFPTRATELRQWPVQLMLVPPTAPFLQGREILLAADCCPFAFADFHSTFLKGKALLIGCPKLDDLSHYRAKLEEIFRVSNCTGVTVMMMEVPCCGGLETAARQALAASGREIPLKEVIIGVRGDVLRETTLVI